MKKLSKYKIDKGIFFTLIAFAFISIITISSAQKLLPSYQQGLVLKQTIWYILGFIIAIIFIFTEFSVLLKFI